MNKPLAQSAEQLVHEIALNIAASNRALADHSGIASDLLRLQFTGEQIDRHMFNAIDKARGMRKRGNWQPIGKVVQRIVGGL